MKDRLLEISRGNTKIQALTEAMEKSLKDNEKESNLITFASQ